MKVLIVAKTRQGRGACIGGINFAGQSVRLIAANAEWDEQAGMEYEVGEVWEVKGAPPPQVVPPHVENVVVHDKRRLGPMSSPTQFILAHMPPAQGGTEVLYEGLATTTRAGALYIAERTGVPPYSTMFWLPDRPLRREHNGKRIHYRYPDPEGGRTLTFVGFQEPLEVLPAGTLLRVSLAHWWRAEDKPEHELRCYVQLSGWFSLTPPPADADAPARARAIATPLASAATKKTPGLRPPPSTPSQVSAAARRLLKDVFGFDDFLPLQAEIIANLLARRHTLAIMPTGSGKSLCYQLPALLFQGLTVVVSPLIALMQDQVDALRELGLPAAYLNSSLTYQEYVQTTARVRAGEVKLIYMAPETLLRPESLVMLDHCQVDCLAIDEAHCISAWGHDFRPEYRQLLSARQRYPQAACLALTATATPRVRADIAAQLGFTESDTFVASFDRPNLFLAVEPRIDGLGRVLAFLEAHRGQAGIIYCSTRDQVDTLAGQLQAQGWPALPYHAGLDGEIRRQYQRRFVRDDAPIIVATVAFGMGIDKSNVRFVLHHNLPPNLERYYQEIGRAGRDGLRADCLLLYSHADTGTIYHFIEQGAAEERPGRRARLDAMLQYVQTHTCRRRPLLAYFGENFGKENCGACDNCLAATGEVEMTDVTVAAQKFLSCVVRTGQLFGAAHIIKVLRGSKAKTILQRGHDRLSTFGIGQEYPAKTWRRLAHVFIEQGLLAQDMEHGSLRLTAAGKEVLRGERPVWTQAETTQAPQASALAGEDVVLFAALRGLRKQLADAADVPPYVVFSDRSLLEMATYYPQSQSSFLAIHGVGQHKLEHYGEAFLNLIRSYCRERGLEERRKNVLLPAPSRPSSSTGRRRFYEVGDLFAAGQSVEDLARRYGVRRGTVIEHLRRYVQAGHELDGERIRAASQLTPEEQEATLAAFAAGGIERLRPIYEALGEAVDWEELHLMRLYLLCEGAS